MRYGVLYGEVYATSPNLEGVSIWLPSEMANMTLWRLIRVGMFSLFFRLGGSFIVRGLRIADFLSSVQQRYAPSRYWLFQFLGIDPEEHLPCYLDTEEEENVPLYQRYGFRVVQELTIPDTDIRLWAMLREKSS